MLGSALFGFLCRLCVLCVSVVVVSHIPITTETQRTQRLHREEIELGHYRMLGLLFALAPITQTNVLVEIKAAIAALLHPLDVAGAHAVILELD